MISPAEANRDSARRMLPTRIQLTCGEAYWLREVLDLVEITLKTDYIPGQPVPFLLHWIPPSWRVRKILTQTIEAAGWKVKWGFHNGSWWGKFILYPPPYWSSLDAEELAKAWAELGR
jgi:hypothetical protein